MNHIINGISTYFQSLGDPGGLPVVFIHGFPFSSEMWKPQVEDLNEFRLILYDVRGHGRTHPGDGQYTVEYFVDDLIALLDHLVIRKAVLVGLSMGGYIALRAVERHPDRFRGLVLCDTKSDADTNDAKIRRSDQGKLVKTKGIPAFTQDFLKAVFLPESFKKHPEAIDLIRKTIEKTTPTALVGTLIGLAARTDTTPSLPAIQMPVLIMVGEGDKVTPPASSRAMREKIKSSELHIIPNADSCCLEPWAGNFMQYQHPTGCLYLVKKRWAYTPPRVLTKTRHTSPRWISTCTHSALIRGKRSGNFIHKGAFLPLP